MGKIIPLLIIEGDEQLLGSAVMAGTECEIVESAISC